MPFALQVTKRQHALTKVCVEKNVDDRSRSPHHHQQLHAVHKTKLCVCDGRTGSCWRTWWHKRGIWRLLWKARAPSCFGTYAWRHTRPFHRNGQMVQRTLHSETTEIQKSKNRSSVNPMITTVVKRICYKLRAPMRRAATTACPVHP